MNMTTYVRRRHLPASRRTAGGLSWRKRDSNYFIIIIIIIIIRITIINIIIIVMIIIITHYYYHYHYYYEQKRLSLGLTPLSRNPKLACSMQGKASYQSMP